VLTRFSERATRLRRRSAGVALRRLPRRSGGLDVLLYHRVATPPHDPWDLAVTPTHFDEQMAVLGATGGAVGLEAAVRRFRRDSLRHRRVAVTFDDGYADNLHAALPALERHDVAATFFIATGFLDQPAFWWDRFDLVVLDPSMATGEVAEAAAAAGLVDAAGAAALGRGGRQELHGALYTVVSALPLEQIGVALDALTERLSAAPPAPDGRPMTTEELAILAAHPLVTIGGHTVRHVRLSRTEPDDAWREITAGAARLEHLLGARPPLFAYPFGDANASAARVVRRTGFDRAFTTEGRAVSALDDPLLIPRRVAPDVDGAGFTRWLAGEPVDPPGAVTTT
jgi:peptidoglycan/xylan/chitin deacetylase (PgdA/CDA1 family)